MLEFLQQNYLTIIIIAVLVLMVALIIRSIVKDKKQAKIPAGQIARIAQMPDIAIKRKRKGDTLRLKQHYQLTEWRAECARHIFATQFARILM